MFEETKTFWYLWSTRRWDITIKYRPHDRVAAWPYLPRETSPVNRHVKPDFSGVSARRLKFVLYRLCSTLPLSLIRDVWLVCGDLWLRSRTFIIVSNTCPYCKLYFQRLIKQTPSSLGPGMKWTSYENHMITNQKYLTTFIVRKVFSFLIPWKLEWRNLIKCTSFLHKRFSITYRRSTVHSLVRLGITSRPNKIRT